MNAVAAPEAPSGATWADPTILQEVRPAVRDLLVASPAFSRLPPGEQQRLAGEMVKVAAYLANPEGAATEELARVQSDDDAGPLATAQADATEAARKRAGSDQGFAGEDFKAGATEAGVEAFGALVQKVDFPKFVGGLIKGVFEAIVDASIRQMQAYGELLANVAKTVDQFAQDNITENSARDWLVDRFPDKLGIGEEGMAGGFAEGDAPPEAQPKVVAKGDDTAAALEAISRELQLLRPINDLSDETQEAELVRQARLQMARSRQQMLASMVVLGINRIVVTDGLINAKVVFDMRASDTAARHSRAAMYDRASQSQSSKINVGYSSWFSPWSVDATQEQRSDHVATVQSSVDETSESKSEVKARLTGEVRVNFKSDYFPMDKLASPQMIGAIQGNATPTAAPAPAAAAGPAAPAPAPAAPRP